MPQASFGDSILSSRITEWFALLLGNTGKRLSCSFRVHLSTLRPFCVLVWFLDFIWAIISVVCLLCKLCDVNLFIFNLRH
jgi:hypothetical protein